jgi:hypothetical protein
MRDYEKKGWFRLRVPDDWNVEEDGDIASFDPPDASGALHVSTLTVRPLKPGERVDVYLMLRAFLKQSTGQSFEDLEPRRWSARGLDWAGCEYPSEDPESGELHNRAWMATNHDIVAFVTWTCLASDREARRAELDAIVESLELK